MVERQKPGLGELLRYVGELVDRGADDEYRAMNLVYRARYTPVMRAIAAGAETIGDITAGTRLTQGAISQTVGLMTADGIVERHSLQDGRKSGVRLTNHGRALLRRLRPRWALMFTAVEALEQEIGHPLLRILEETALALERRSLAVRLRAAGARSAEAEHADAD